MSAIERTGLLAAFAAGGLVLGCSDSGSTSTGQSSLTVGSANVRVDPNQSGNATRLGLAEASWGRLVDVYDHNPETGTETLRYVDLAVGADVSSIAGQQRLVRHAAAGRDRLTLLHAFGSPEFEALLARAEVLEPLAGAGFALDTLPRDAALALRFDDLIDPAAIATAEVHATVEGRVAAVRVVADPNHGDWADLDGDGVAEFHTTRVLIDPVASELDALRDGAALEASSGWLGGGLVDLSVAGLASSSGAPLTGPQGGRAIDLSFAVGASSMGLARPVVIGEQPIDVTLVDPAGGNRYVLDYTFATTRCGSYPGPGDVIVLAGAQLEVVHGGSVSFTPLQGTVSGVRTVLFAGSTVSRGPGLYRAPYEPDSGDQPRCFVTFSPTPGKPPVKQVSSDASVRVRFSQAMDLGTFEALSTFNVQRETPAGPLEEKVVGQVIASLGLDEFTFSPSVPLATSAGAPTAYLFDVMGGASGVKSLGGAALAADLPAVRFEMDPNQPAVDSSSIALEFDSADEDGNGFPELRGQFFHDLSSELIRPRPVTRFSAAADTQSPTVGSMIPITGGVQTPLSPLGSKMMTSWRYHDVGWSLLDENYHNMDVEGLSWAPAGGQVIMDDFAEFRMALAHGSQLPDEDITTGLLPVAPSSGLVNSYDGNVLDPAGAPLAVVHAKSSGYHVDPADIFTSVSGRPMMPWPMNQGVPVSQFNYWTWRDTGVQAVGAPNGLGVDTKRLLAVGGVGIANFYTAGNVPTIGLPLLTEYRTYADNQALGLNGFQVAVAINSSARPYFRSFSTGGVLSNGQVLIVDPDNENNASGGVNPITGGKTAPQDNAFYYGQADFVVRVSRAHTIWFDTGGTTSFGAPLVEPTPQSLPVGTQVALAFRGADSVTSATAGAWERAGLLGVYGDAYSASQLAKLAGNPNEAFSVNYLNGDSGWKDDLSELDGATLVQARITMVSNPETAGVATVSGLGIPFVR
jgi:hypothetical protein